MKHKTNPHGAPDTPRAFTLGERARESWRERIPALSEATARAETTAHRAREAYALARNQSNSAAAARAAYTARAARNALATARALADGKRVPFNAYQVAARVARLATDQKKTPTPAPRPAPFKKAKRARFRADDAPAAIRRALGTPPTGPKPYAVRALRALARDLAKLADWMDTHRALEIHTNHRPAARAKRAF